MSSKVIIADDDELVRSAIEKIITMFGHTVIGVDSGIKLLETIDESFDVIILDINMPHMDGFTTLELLNQKKLGTPVLFLTGAGSMDYAVRAINLGAYDFITKPIEDINIFNIKIKRAIEKRNYVRGEIMYRQNLEDEVRIKTQELAKKNILLEQYSQYLEDTAVQIMSSLQAALEEKDEYTAGHTKRVTEYAILLGGWLNLSKEEMLILKRASLLHDIGKLVIDLSCIRKPDKLNIVEWELIKKHPEVGANIIEPFKFMERERIIIRHHHERFDGNGYPDAIGEKELDILTRIITVADCFDAMTSRRNYRSNLSMTEAVTELRRCSGTQLDPELVEVFSEKMLSEKKSL